MADQELKKSIKIQNNFGPQLQAQQQSQQQSQSQQYSTGISRERSFIRTSNNNQQNVANKRRSLALQQQTHQQQQLRAKPAMEIYRPPSKYLSLVVGNHG